MRPLREGLSMAQIRVLSLILRTPSASLSAVAEHISGSLPTTSRIVGGLVTRGYLARKGCSNDRRQLSLVITRRGRAVLNRAWSHARDAIATEMAALTEPQRETIIEAMKIFRDMFGRLEIEKAGVNGDDNGCEQSGSTQRG
jgi:DNA-binding MarR family transcriptional regulator